MVVGVVALALAGGCAGIPPAQVGQAAGTIAGSAIVPGVGAPLGALVGLLAGMLVQNQVDKVTEKRERKELGEQMASGSPRPDDAVDPPQGEPVRVWIDESVKNGRRLPGHFDVRYMP